MCRPLLLFALSCGCVLSPPQQPDESPSSRWDRLAASRVVPLLQEVVAFQTVQGNTQARLDQQAWLLRTASSLSLVAREAGLITEIELPGPPGSPVLGLVVHGDVQPVDPSAWVMPPFSGTLKDGSVFGRGSCDDKGPLVQALLAMDVLRQSGVPLTHNVRLLVGSDEESDNQDIKTYLANHAPPDLSLVLDSAFPVVVGEKAWNGLVVSAPDSSERTGRRLPYSVASIDAGISPSIIPDRAHLALAWHQGTPDWTALTAQLRARPLDPGTRLELNSSGKTFDIVVKGHAAHAGMNIEGGRNALVSLARLVDGLLPASGPADLLAFAIVAGQDLFGTGLELTETDAIWGRATCAPTQLTTNTKLLDAAHDGQLSLVVNIRSTPAWVGKKLETHLFEEVARFNARTGAHLNPGGFFSDTPLAFDPKSKLIRRLLADYRSATGREDPPAISGGGTYAKRLPHAIAFGMWFPGKPYPGHDVDEHIPIEDLQAGGRVLTTTLMDLATSAPMREPFAP
jgi:predicted dipeptidase